MTYQLPVFGYPGGKARLREWLVQKMPFHGRRYVEPFAGRGNVFWLAVHMLDYQEWWLNDPWTARWFEAIQRVDLRSIPDELTEVLVHFFRNRILRNRDGDDIATAIESSILFGGGIEDGIGMHWKRSPSLIGLKQRIVFVRSILHAIRYKITALEWNKCRLASLSDQDFVYLDPPYINSPSRCYHHTVSHPELLDYLGTAPHMWMLSGYSSPLYLRYLGEPEARTKHLSFGYQGKGRKYTTHDECIWTNYTLLADGSVRRKRLKRGRIHKKIRQK